LRLRGREAPAAPAVEAARPALEAALDAWKGGKPPGTIDGATRVHAVDTDWQRGQTLEGYEILADEPGAGSRTFTVRLTLGGPTRQQEVRYVVLGTEPVNVMREEDFRRNADMEDAPPAARCPSSAGQTTPGGRSAGDDPGKSPSTRAAPRR